MLDIKRCVEEFKPEGYSCDGYGKSVKYLIDSDLNHYYVHKTEFSVSPQWVGVYYPLFLKRVRQAINKNDESDYFIDLSRHYCRVINWDCTVIEEYPDTDKGLEQAIQYILDQL